MTHPTEPAVASADMSLEHWFNPLTQGQVGVTHDSGGNPRPSVRAAIAHGGNAGDELSLADRTHLLWAGRAIHRVALQKYCRHDIVPAAQVGEQFVQQVTLIGPLPKVM